MSCFWTSLFSRGLFHDCKEVTCARDIIPYLKKHNTRAPIIVNGNLLREKQMTENIDAITELKDSYFCNGYWTSTSDPVLCLLSFLTNTHVIHEWHLTPKVTIVYSPLKDIENNTKKIIHLHSDRGHAW